tara:strand:- start:100765 stop:101352 length:588 start_codon:yes stop_codon:yes gene_type:complete
VIILSANKFPGRAMNYFSRALTSALILLFSSSIHAKVDPPNYDFSLEALEVFMPGSTLRAATKKHGKAQIIKKDSAVLVHKFYVAHIRYKFPVLVQSVSGKITDFYARLPAYFLHDIFHQSIINRIGKQDIYKKVEEQAVYVWKGKKGLRHVYSGACTITCFPIFYAVFPENPEFKDFTPLLKSMAAQEVQNVSK